MKRYISGIPVTDVKDILQDGQDYILILDEGSIDFLEEIEKRQPTVVLSDYSLAFSHVPSFLQMVSIPLFFIPENRERTYETYHERKASIDGSIVTGTKSTLEEIRGLEYITVDTFYSIVFPGTAQAYCGQENATRIDLPDDFEVHMSIKSKHEPNAIDVDADGVGLIFTELIFFENHRYPRHFEQREIFQKIFLRNKSEKYTVRLFDINYDKIPKWLQGIRLGNYDRPLFERFFRFYLDEQLRCICDLAKSEEYSISILIPFVRNIDDVIYIRECVDSCKSAYRERIKIGAMIENVAVISEIPDMHNDIDYFSVGSNDFINSFLEAKRTDILTPVQLSRIIRDGELWELLSKIKQLAGSKPIRICGQLPIFPEALEKLVNIGYKRFTVSPQWVKQLKYQIFNLYSQ